YSAVNSEYSLTGSFGALAKAGLASGGDGAVIDLRPLFDHARRDKAMNPELRRMIMSFDAFVIFRDGEWGSVKRFETPNFRWYPE
ncbi:MAG: hypothetical protein J5I65_05530, partial [Aridibacter famidurans]|nr:hypothetical protein [Aridibacter famidurans]